MNDYTIANAKERALEALLPNPERFATVVNEFSTLVRLLNDRWWRDPETGELITRNDGEMIALMHSELSEALEGVRKGMMDSHLPHRKSIEVELADTIIRILDYAGNYRLDLGGAIIEKLHYNWHRQDHTLEARKADGGKKF